jgi:2,4-dienoyl-CoA reductase-like NADH-dependent reductase (Old Yellow Enzyme family)
MSPASGLESGLAIIFGESGTTYTTNEHVIEDLQMASLFDSIQMGDIRLPNRIIMAPLTRLRGTADHLPTRLMVEYYTQRASAGLIISEGIPVAPQAVGYTNVPGIWSPMQTDAWKPVTDSVHKAGGRIFAQLWHVGRISDPRYLGGERPVAPSAIQPAGHISLVRPITGYVTPRALQLAEIPDIVERFRKAAENAKLSGFDGVEIHGANGYLLDQFLQDGTNQRNDRYGGTIENRARLLLEVTDAVVSVWGSGRVGMHLAPRSDSHDMHDSNPAATFGYVASEIRRRGLAFLCAREYYADDRLGPQLKKLFGGVYIANERYTQALAERVIQDGEADAVAFGQLFIANPDLPARFARNAPLNTPDSNRFFMHGRHGYTDYSNMSEAEEK